MNEYTELYNVATSGVTSSETQQMIDLLTSIDYGVQILAGAVIIAFWCFYVYFIIWLPIRSAIRF